MADVDGSRQSVEAQTPPIPEFKSEDVGGCADFEHHAVFAGAVHGPCRDQDVVVLFDRPAFHVLFGIERSAAVLRRFQFGDHHFGLDVFPQTEINASIFLHIEHVIALVLCVKHAEMLADVFGQRMHLQAQVAPVHGIEEIETNGKFCAKTGIYILSQQLPWLVINQVNRGYFHRGSIKIEQQAVLLRHTIETPGIVHRRPVEVAYFLHPLPAPGARIEKRDHAERLGSRLFQGSPYRFAGSHFRAAFGVGVQHKIPVRHEFSFQAVAHPPVGKIGAFVHPAEFQRLVVDTETGYGLAPHPLLDFPARHVCINQQVPALRCYRSACAIHHHQAPGIPDACLHGCQLLRVEKLFDGKPGHVAENAVVGHIGICEAVDFRLTQKGVSDIEKRGGLEPVFYGLHYFIVVYTGVGFYNDDRFLRPSGRYCGLNFFNNRLPSGPTFLVVAGDFYGWVFVVVRIQIFFDCFNWYPSFVCSIWAVGLSGGNMAMIVTQ